MLETRKILKMHRARLAEVHLSKVNSLNGHESPNELEISNFKRVADTIAARLPMILESPVDTDKISVGNEKRGKKASATSVGICLDKMYPRPLGRAVRMHDFGLRLAEPDKQKRALRVR